MNSLRRSAPNAADLDSLARRLGRSPVKRGKEPMWESDRFDDLCPLSIPHHGGRGLAPGTKNSILNQREHDLPAWDEILEEDEDDDAG